MNQISFNVILIILLVSPTLIHAECAQFQIIDHGDRVEAVCVGDGGQASSGSSGRANTSQINQAVTSLMDSKESENQRLSQLKQDLSRITDKIQELNEEKKNMNNILIVTPPLARVPAMKEIARIMDETTEQRKEESRIKADVRKCESDIASIQRRIDEARR
ncbi:MAG: hypothetical protein WCI45_00190 [Desulfuromonadales bacterium]